MQEDREGKQRMMLKKGTEEDKAAIFQLASDPNNFDEIQTKLQTVDFNVNTDRDCHGDFLLHAVCRRGLSQLPLVMSLVKLHGADVELCNTAGMTPLMVAASAGDPVLCDVLVCLFGAEANSVNPRTGQTALHYAVQANHCSTAQCLIRRGADVNQEDDVGRRPDDVALTPGLNDQCLRVVHLSRLHRMDCLSQLIQKGEMDSHHLAATDLCVVNEDGYTLIMIAAIYNRSSALEVLLTTGRSTLDAQHLKSGMTALSIGAQMGHVEAVTTLLTHGANPAIPDMKSYLPLHYAVRNNQEKVVDTMLQFFPQCYSGLHMATTLCQRTAIHAKLQSALTRRQEVLVTPSLMTCAVTGDADQLYRLLEDGDDVNIQSETGSWPLYLAVENGHLDVVKLLLERGADVRKHHCRTGETILHVSARLGQGSMTQYLLTLCRQADPEMTSSCPCHRLIDVNVLDHHGRTPLQLAAQRGYSQVVQSLLSCGASTALLDSRGQLITCPQFEGVRMLLESHRQRHRDEVMSLISSGSRKAMDRLRQVWLPRFDHNLRTDRGDTPLMAACSGGRLQVLHFLLQSAVYPHPLPHCGGYNHADDSDADSGVPDPGTGTLSPRPLPLKASDGEDSQGSGGLSQSMESPTGRAVLCSADLTASLSHRPAADTVLHRAHRGDSRFHSMMNVHLCQSHLSQSTLSAHLSQSVPNAHCSLTTPSAHHFLTTLLQDVSRPKGLSVFHDGLVSHVCAVSHGDGSTALHRAIERGDNVSVVNALLTSDPACLNLQNDAGLSPLHLALKLDRRRVVSCLLKTEGIDLNARTLDCRLPEEMTSNKALIRVITTARLHHSAVASVPTLPGSAPHPSPPPLPALKMAASHLGTYFTFHRHCFCCQELCDVMNEKLELT